MPASDPVLERITAHSWPRGELKARWVRGGYTLTSARTGAPVARLRPMPSGDGRFEVLWWRREAWGRAGPFGAVLALDDALAFIGTEPAFPSSARSDATPAASPVTERQPSWSRSTTIRTPPGATCHA